MPKGGSYNLAPAATAVQECWANIVRICFFKEARSLDFFKKYKIFQCLNVGNNF